ncbi:MAG TPA: LysE family transporter [Actinomycetales bacterium]|nr:LysE family transporter [Actinomycetales bacterium]
MAVRNRLKPWNSLELSQALAMLAELLTSMATGVVAGLGVALPLGPVGILLLQEGITRGRRAGLAAATGVAAVDGVYAVLASIFGGALAGLLYGHEHTVRLVAAVVLGAVAVHGLARVAKSRRSVVGDLNAGGTDAEASPLNVRGRRPASSFVRFAALTAVNPLTIVYFVTVTTALGAAAGAAGVAVFALGVLVASWSWQAVLAVAGSGAGRLLLGRGRSALPAVANTLVLVLAVGLAVR